MRKGTTIKEEWINSSLDVPFQHLGWAGQLNGPVDNSNSSCLSCHGTAQWPVAAPLAPPRGTTPDSVEWMKWFRNIKGGSETFSMNTTSLLDYSPQLAAGLTNFYEWKAIVDTMGGNRVSPATLSSTPMPYKTYPVSRGGTEE